MAKGEEVRIFGIRHHGAGSSRNLLNALDALQPDLMLIECPVDAQMLTPFVMQDLLIPPVAIMIWDKNDLTRYAYYPFTSFSPEWQAMQFAKKHDVHVRFFDLPQGISFVLPEGAIKTGKMQALTNDPFSYMASLAGYDDPERWWDSFIEQDHDGITIFNTILEMMTEMRTATSYEKSSNAVREAFMRNEIRSAIREGYQKIAVVCGAWHGPALATWQQEKAAEDKALIRGHKKVQTACTWVPWSYNRIARHTGYGSGVISPYWYEALFEDPDKALSKWMSRASQILQSMGHAVSPAHTIDATKLTLELTRIRNRNRPGINELFDAMSTTFCQGDESLIERMRTKLLEGENIGKVSDQIPMVPLYKDLEVAIKKARLQKDWKNQSLIEKHLDLRKPTQLLASRLLHRMFLLEIPWGVELEPDHNPLGNFHEYWELQWLPDFEIKIIEASIWGNTIVEACHKYTMDKINEESQFSQLGQVLYTVLHADLPDLIGPVSDRIRDLGNVSEDVLLLMQITPPLIWSRRYGDTAQLNTSSVEALLDQLLPRICILLPAAVIQVADDQSKHYFTAISQLHHAIQLMDRDDILHRWMECLQKIAFQNPCNAIVKGMTLRFLLVKEVVEVNQIYLEIEYHLSTIADPFYPALLLEGFLYGGGWLLIHRPTLRDIVDQWMSSLDDDTFMNFLPILRRTFSTFTSSEKEVIYDLLFGREKHIKTSFSVDTERQEIARKGLNRLL